MFISPTEPGVPIQTERNKLKVAFLQSDKSQLECRIKDLEKTIRINKEIISELLNGAQGNRQARNIMEKMNRENRLLQAQLKSVSKEREDYHAQLLISQQIITNYRVKEQEQIAEYQEKVRDLLDQLNQKEFVLQYVQLRYDRMETLLKKYSGKEDEIFLFLRELAAEGMAERTTGITNVIEENKRLQSEVKEARERIKALEAKLAVIVATSDAKTASTSEQQRVLDVPKSNDALTTDEINRVLCARVAELEEELLRKNCGGETAPPEKKDTDRHRRMASGLVETRAPNCAETEPGNKSELLQEPSFGDISSIMRDAEATPSAKCEVAKRTEIN